LTMWRRALGTSSTSLRAAPGPTATNHPRPLYDVGPRRTTGRAQLAAPRFPLMATPDARALVALSTTARTAELTFADTQASVLRAAGTLALLSQAPWLLPRLSQTCAPQGGTGHCAPGASQVCPCRAAGNCEFVVGEMASRPVLPLPLRAVPLAPQGAQRGLGLSCRPPSDSSAAAANARWVINLPPEGLEQVMDVWSSLRSSGHTTARGCGCRHT
jgi:hypothetical protein